MKKIVHYNLDEIDKQGSQFNLIWGERSNGKSYQVKHKKGINPFLFESVSYKANYKNKNEIIKNVCQSGKRFILMRRWKEEITSEKIERYFADIDIVKITNGKYNCITFYRKQLYLANYNNDNGKTTRGELIGYVVALSTEQNYAGSSYLDVTDIIFEEFMSRSVYIGNEPDKLMNFYSTVDRKRGITRVWLVGNTISRVCPYIEEWGLHQIISKQKQGEIVSKWIPTGDIDEDGVPIEIKLSIEYCQSTGQSSFVIGKHKDMLNSGSWQTDAQPHLPKSRKEYKLLYRIMFQYQSFKFVGEYLKENKTNNVCWFIYPYDGDIKEKIIVFSDEIKISPYWQRDIYNITINNDKLRNLFQTFRESNIFYASDLCGTDFKQVIDFTIKK